MDLKFDGIRECLNHWVFELPNVDCICLYLLYMILEHAIGITDTAINRTRHRHH